MRCLFCKQDSSKSRSVEHIIPESLGNLSHTLAAGIICDKCNNYFASKVEKQFLELDAVRHLRFHQSIVSKRGRVPSIEAILLPDFEATMYRHPKSKLSSVGLGPRAIEHLLNSDGGTLVLPGNFALPKGKIVSRFLAKVALEAMAYRLSLYPDGLAYLTDEEQLDPIRNHARRGEIQDWPFHIRTLYKPNAKWINESGEATQIVHEFDILQTTWNEWFFILAIFGLEMVINYGGPEIDGYERWLCENNDTSPLYSDKNSGTPFSKS